MGLSFTKAGTSDALTLNGISKRAFDSDVKVGAVSPGGPPDICRFRIILKWPE